jgi:hypothetical protein
VKRDADKGHGRSFFEDALRLKFAVCLTCLLLFVAAIDTIPDPPAINPPGGHSGGISALHVRGPYSLLEKEWFVAPVSPRRFQVNWFSFRLALDSKPLGISPLLLVLHAADASPPVFS